MNVFFDNCTSPVLATTLHGYLTHRGHSASHIKDLPCGRNASDIEWMAYLHSTGEPWLVGDGDHHILARRDPRMLDGIAIVQVGVCGFDGQLPAIRHGVACIDARLRIALSS